MAQFSKVNGDLLPVLHLDSPAYTNSGANAIVSEVPVQPQGPKLDFFTVTATGALTGTQVNLIIQATQQLATVYMYEYGNTTNDTVAMAVYPTGAWDTTTLDAACTNALATGGVANSLAVSNLATFGALYC
jgi:hypothetical protein